MNRAKQGIRIRPWFMVLAMVLGTGCQRRVETETARVGGPTAVSPDEEYVMVTTIVNFPLYVRHDQAAFKRWGEQMGVKTAILGPSDWDVPAQIAAIEQVIPTKPTGLLINGTELAIADAINKAVEAGIPTVVYDSDVPSSKRHAFIGSDWYGMGRSQGRAMVRLLGGRGKVAYMGIVGMSNQEAGFRGLEDVIKEHKGIETVGPFNDKCSMEEAARVTSDIISAHPDIAGICGFTGTAGPGIAMAVKEAGKVGKIKITTVDWEPEHLRLLQDGVIQHLVGQKRELFTWYGAQFLFDMVHGAVRFTEDDAKAGVAPVPYSVDTGLIEITPENVHMFL